MKLELPKKFNYPKKEVRSLKEIWFGEHINYVRTMHSKNSLESVEICKNCPFKETYQWKKLIKWWKLLPEIANAHQGNPLEAIRLAKACL